MSAMSPDGTPDGNRWSRRQAAATCRRAWLRVNARPPFRTRARRHRRQAARDRGFAGALRRSVSWPASHRVITFSLAAAGLLLDVTARCRR